MIVYRLFYDCIRPRPVPSPQLHSFVAALPHLLEMKKSITAHVNIAALLTAATEHDAALEFHATLRAESEQLVDNKRDVTREWLEGMLLRQRPWERVLRAMIAYSLHNGGFRRAHFDQFRDEFVQSYGAALALPTLHALDRVGWLCCMDARAQRPTREYVFARLRRAYRLIADCGAPGDPDDISFAYSYSTYAPLSIRVRLASVERGYRVSQELCVCEF